MLRKTLLIVGLTMFVGCSTLYLQPGSARYIAKQRFNRLNEYLSSGATGIDLLGMSANNVHEAYGSPYDIKHLGNEWQIWYYRTGHVIGGDLEAHFHNNNIIGGRLTPPGSYATDYITFGKDATMEMIQAKLDRENKSRESSHVMSASEAEIIAKMDFYRANPEAMNYALNMNADSNSKIGYIARASGENEHNVRSKINAVSSSRDISKEDLEDGLYALYGGR